MDTGVNPKKVAELLLNNALKEISISLKMRETKTAIRKVCPGAEKKICKTPKVKI